ncbi:TRAP transporter substrate-binding protein [Rhizobium sp. TRM96647]|uniref:TRAP transporter substrate-binding protein n=1 Tax=unclassified Rhizobium TaxID=2613769 RepID=UPI0021E6DCE0|nr:MULTISPECIES: TRAP transporter substrate-binding protein [unclassified Rhizobium]MCV3734912.1 TRAP transporter substrate-binding protein [Rhizobium sp. TRM96647]MCV3757282.1 TRAP transporter substrate-binding protein [Rhizobium sp. TRM96650]
MTRLTRRLFLRSSATAAMLAAPALVRPAHARATTITVASLLGEDKPETKIWRQIAGTVEARLPGRFRFNVVANGALGGEKEVAEGARLGSVHASLATLSSLAGWVPEGQILDLPFLYRDADHVRRVIEGPVGEDLKLRLQAQNFVVGGFIDYGARHLLTKEPVTEPAQMQGMKMRVIQSPLHTRLWNAYGAIPVGVPITETYNALSTGVADAMDLTKSAYAGFRLYEVVPYLSETAHIRASGVVYFAAGFWNGLPEAEREVLREASALGADAFNRLIVEDEAASVRQAIAGGGEVVKVDAREAWERGAEIVWRDLADVVGGWDRIATVQGA